MLLAGSRPGASSSTRDNRVVLGPVAFDETVASAARSVVERVRSLDPAVPDAGGGGASLGPRYALIQRSTRKRSVYEAR